MRNFYSTLLILILLGGIGGCKNSSESSDNNKKSPFRNEFISDIDLEEIKKRGYLTAIIENSSTSLFLYKGQPMGYEYDLLKIFCEEIGVELRLDITSNLNEGFEKLNSGQGDILAYSLTVTKERKERINFSHYHNQVRQVLVQRKPDNWRKMKLHEIEKKLIRNPIDLIGKQVFVRNGSAYHSRLKNLSDEIGGDIIIVEDFPDVETEALIRKVALGEIEYTVADEDIALVNETYYSILDTRTPLSLPQQIAWGVRKKSTKLLDEVNSWIIEMRKDVTYYTIYDKYFRSTNQSKARLKSDFFYVGNGSISPYDSLIKVAARDLDWDWRLIAAQINKESKFNPNVESWAGAQGLMQLMPVTGREYGIEDLLDPEENIRAGKKHLIWLKKFWANKVRDSTEHVKFVLASYNVGHGHLLDAVRLTKKYGKDTAVWEDNVEFYLLQKSYSKFFNDPVVKYGYCRGIEPVNYVREILNTYQNYLDIIPPEPASVIAAQP
jgi:membrane-bound lytic murein transglycosylase F